jgi:hypothetical protein
MRVELSAHARERIRRVIVEGGGVDEIGGDLGGDGRQSVERD